MVQNRRMVRAEMQENLGAKKVKVVNGEKKRNMMRHTELTG